MNSESSHLNISPTASGSEPERSSSRRALFWIPLVICVFAVPAVPVAFFLGAMIGNTQIYNNFATHQQHRIEAFFHKHPSLYDRLTISHASNGWVYLHGIVHSQEDYYRLNRKLFLMFGDELAEMMIAEVDIEGPDLSGSQDGEVRAEDSNSEIE